jgi:hypothetical protein
MAFYTGWYLMPQNDGYPILEPVCWVQEWDATKVWMEIRCFPPLPEKRRQGWGTRRFVALSVSDIKPGLVATAAAAGERRTGECKAQRPVF